MVSNYTLMLRSMELLFLDYDQDKIIRKFNLRSDDEHIYINLVGREYFIERKNGRAGYFVNAINGRGATNGFPPGNEPDESGIVWAGFNDGATIYDYLCKSADFPYTSGEYASMNSFSTAVSSPGDGKHFWNKYAKIFDADTERLKKTFESMGAVEMKSGDVSYAVELFDNFPVWIRFWCSDDEFPCDLQLMWDKNTLKFIDFETMHYAGFHLLDRVLEEFNRIGGKHVSE